MFDQGQLGQLASVGYRLTPATFAHNMSGGEWIPARHLLYISTRIAQKVREGGARIIVSMPPRHGKSQLLSVWTPVWYLNEYPQNEVILTSYGAELATDFSREARNLIVEHESNLTVKLRKDVKRSDHFITTAKGRMLGTGIGGIITGRGANLFLVDDYIKNAEASLSLTQRGKDYQWFISTARTRLEPGGSIVILATRWHINDLIGRLLVDMPGRWDVITLPAIALHNDVLGRAPGEALWPGRWPLEELYDLRDTLGSYWWQAEFQQDPLPSMAGILRSNKLKPVDVMPHESFLKTVRAWDFAATEGGGDFTAGFKLSKHKSKDEFYIRNVKRGQWSVHKTESEVAIAAREDAAMVMKILIEQEPGSSGKIAVAHYDKDILPEFSVKGVHPTGPIEVRASPFLAAVEAGKMYMEKGEWNEAFKTEVDAFPEGDYDDIVTSGALAYNELTRGQFGGAVWGRQTYASGEKSQILTRTGNIINSGVTWGRRA